MSLQKHISKSYNQDIKDINDEINQMLELNNQALRFVKSCIDNPDTNLAGKIKEHDKKTNLIDAKIEKKVVSILALRQPMSSDLRYVVSSLRVAANLERIGDKCKNIIKEIIYIKDNLDDKNRQILLKMLEISSRMLNSAVISFNKGDVDLAIQILAQDDEIDDIYKNNFAEILQQNNFDKMQARIAINIILITKNFERIADHASNIAEITNYVVTGEINE